MSFVPPSTVLGSGVCWVGVGEGASSVNRFSAVSLIGCSSAAPLPSRGGVRGGVCISSRAGSLLTPPPAPPLQGRGAATLGSSAFGMLCSALFVALPTTSAVVPPFATGTSDFLHHTIPPPTATANRTAAAAHRRHNTACRGLASACRRCSGWRRTADAGLTWASMSSHRSAGAGSSWSASRWRSVCVQSSCFIFPVGGLSILSSSWPAEPWPGRIVRPTCPP